MSYLNKKTGATYANLKEVLDVFCDEVTKDVGCNGCPMRGVRTESGDRVCVECNSHEELLPYEAQIMSAVGLTYGDDRLKEIAAEMLEEYGLTNDPVNHPGHYTQGGIECIDAIEAAIGVHADPVGAFLTGQVIKYSWRWPLKSKPIEDLKKARWYLERLIKYLEEKET